MALVNDILPYGKTLAENLHDLYLAAKTSHELGVPVDYTGVPFGSSLTAKAANGNPAPLTTATFAIQMQEIATPANKIRVEATNIHSFVTAIIAAVNSDHEVEDGVNSFLKGTPTTGLYGSFCFEYDNGL